MSLFDISRAGAVHNALEAAKESRARDPRARYAHQQQALPNPAAPMTERPRWRARIRQVRSLLFG